MFLRVKIRKEDRDSLRFLWRNNMHENPQEYRMTSLIFGAASSPCTAIYIKNRNASEFELEYPEACKAIRLDHYVDDFLKSFNSIEEARRVSKQVYEIHRKAAFELRGWASNEIEWDINNDALGFNLGLRNTPTEVLETSLPPTKRQVTSAVMSVFDPLGLASPVLITGKCMLQDIWRSGIDWDETIEADAHKKWLKWVNDIKKLASIRIPRCISPGHTEGELHVFVDASEKSYAAAVYWRIKLSEHESAVSLIAGKARVAPLKVISIPRLELQAALLGARLASSILTEIELNVTRKIFWTDSRTVLSWIRSDPRSFKPFVAHRLAELEEHTTVKCWRWVPTKLNVADDATRDPPTHFDETHRWFHGPDFLRKAKTNGRRKLLKANSRRGGEIITARVLQAIDLFRVKRKVNALKHKRTATKTSSDPTWKHISKKAHTPAQKDKRRLEENDRHPLSLNCDYIRRAETLLLLEAQKCFEKETTHLREGKAVTRRSRLRKFAMEIDENGVLRLKGRIKAAKDVSFTLNRPAVLSGDSSIAKLIMKHYHERFNHGNHNTVMNEIRQKYYITSLRSKLRKIAHECQWCRINRSLPKMPSAEGDLPPERLRHHQPPFTCTGGRLFRAYELHDIGFASIHRSKRNSESDVFGQRHEFRRRKQRTDEHTRGTREDEEADIRTILRKFIPPGAPNMGGAWERLVRSVKTALAATLRERSPREEVLHTLLLEAEHIVNSRPLTEVDVEPAEAEGLTPNHFLIGRSCGAAAAGHFDDNVLLGPANWRTCQRLADHFWQRWLREYLPTLVPRRRGDPICRAPAEGDIVLIVDSSSPRYSWPRGRIKKTYPGPDNQVRVVDVETTGGVLRRPTSKIVVLVSAEATAVPCPEV
ncbi:hypothetical protein EVAR_57569_1 [Eumeta japonica]|uniref:DUF5641 domain-containing protein n=2 Tax=Eumeta variegata TaxID=151549 RepID=A0A4C1Z9H9_EUMVA|nr:hypothetical protein EVAR_57569_1 [Eumeta japonica]